MLSCLLHQRCIDMSCKATAQYLARYAEAEVELLHDFPPLAFRHCLIIPCFRESVAFAERLTHSPLSHPQLLIIVVVNQTTPQPVALNQALLQYFSAFGTIWQHGHLRLCQAQPGTPHWLIVDRCQYPLPAKQGVGLARKIGCDLAVAMQQQGHLQTQWLHNSDADAHLPANYLDLPSEPYTAAVYSFKHIPADAAPEVWQATQLYEQALRYYVAGLAWAGSAFAQQPIGSTLACTAKAYCQVRGFPKRSAGEDFYLLNKLAKLGPVFQAQATVEIEARVSDRVPFGTGPQVQSISALANPSRDFCYYHPQTFVQLKTWLAAMPEVWFNLQRGCPPLAGLNLQIQQALTEAGADRVWNHIKKQSANAQACQRELHTWFDGFQTLKFLRRLQAAHYPPLPLWQCLQEAPFRVSFPT